MASTVTDVLMTYAELANRLSIKTASAKRLAQRRKWKRVIGNDGAARVHVPTSAIVPGVPDDVTTDVSGDLSLPVTPDLSHRVAHLEGLVEGLRGQLEAQQHRAEAEQRRAEAAEARIQDIAADREAWKRQAQRSIWLRLFGSN